VKRKKCSLGLEVNTGGMCTFLKIITNIFCNLKDRKPIGWMQG